MDYVWILREELIFNFKSYHGKREVVAKIHIIEMPHSNTENFWNTFNAIHHIFISCDCAHIIQHIIVLDCVCVEEKTNQSRNNCKPNIRFESCQCRLLWFLLWFYDFLWLHKNRTVNIIFKSESQ